MVEIWEGSNSLSVNLRNMHVFPTPESPSMSSLNNTSYCLAMSMKLKSRSQHDSFMELLADASTSLCAPRGLHIPSETLLSYHGQTIDSRLKITKKRNCLLQLSTTANFKVFWAGENDVHSLIMRSSPHLFNPFQHIPFVFSHVLKTFPRHGKASQDLHPWGRSSFAVGGSAGTQPIYNI